MTSKENKCKQNLNSYIDILFNEISIWNAIYEMLTILFKTCVQPWNYFPSVTMMNEYLVIVYYPWFN